MASRTTRFGLNHFDDSVPGSILDDGKKHTGHDRVLLDQLLAATEAHSHAWSVQDVAAPTTAPGAVVSSGGGSLKAGSDYSYKVTFVDSDGLETVAGSEVTVSTPDLLDPPAVPSGETNTAGALTVGVYDYALTAVRDTEQSALGDPFTVTLVAGEDSVDLVLPTLGAADFLRVWRRKSTESGYTLIGDNQILTTFTDDGSVAAYPFPTDPAYAPPTSNTGVDIYSVTVTLSAADQAVVQSFAGWRLYRSTVAGSYSAQSLVATVTDRVGDLPFPSPLLVAWVDFGDALLTGTPSTVDQRMHFQPLQLEVLANIAALVGTRPLGYPLLTDEGKLYAQLTAGMTLIGGGGGDSWLGPWAIGTAYQPGALVKQGNGLYHAVAASTGVDPADPPVTAGPYMGEYGDATPVDLATAGIPSTSALYQWFTPTVTSAGITQVQFYLPASSTLTVDCEIYTSTGPADPAPVLVGTFTKDLTGEPVGWVTLTGAAITLTGGVKHQVGIFEAGFTPSPPIAVLGTPSAPEGLAEDGDVYYWDGATYAAQAGSLLAYRFPQVPALGDVRWELVSWIVPAGGTTGQTLTKISNDDGDYGWA